MVSSGFILASVVAQQSSENTYRPSFRTGVVVAYDYLTRVVELRDGPLRCTHAEDYTPQIGDVVIYAPHRGNPYVLGRIGGGYHQLINAPGSDLLGGELNLIEDSADATMVAGTSNSITSSSDNSTVIGGTLNTVSSSPSASVVAGESNTVHASQDSVSVGGLDNTLYAAPGSTILGGGLEASGVAANGNTMQFTRSSTIVGGYNNAIQGGYQAGIFSAWTSLIDSLSYGGTIQFSTIIGGSQNVMRCANSGILAGHTNVIGTNIWGWNAIVAGGENTMEDSKFSAMVGTGGPGVGSDMTGSESSVIVGGQNHEMDSSAMSGMFAGQRNIINGVGGDTKLSAIIGGDDNEISGSSTTRAVIIASQTSEITGNKCGFIAGSRNATVYHNRSALIACDGQTSARPDTLHTNDFHIFGDYLFVGNLPTSSTGLPSGAVYLNGTNRTLRAAP